MKKLYSYVLFCRQEKLTDLQSMCSVAVQSLVNCSIAEPIQSALTSELKAVFGEKYEDVSLAVRSSAAGIKFENSNALRW